MRSYQKFGHPLPWAITIGNPSEKYRRFKLVKEK
jgi:hypothetical protein